MSDDENKNKLGKAMDTSGKLALGCLLAIIVTFGLLVGFCGR